MIELPIRVAAPDVSHVDALASGTRLGEFEILGLIGVGGFGMVYRAYDHSLQRDVAIKEYLPSTLAGRREGTLNISVRTPADHETFRIGLQSFVDEARMLARFEHPSLVRVLRFWEANDTAYMVMPLYRGMTLKQARMRMQMPPPEAWLRKVMWAILGALKVLHRGNALHRDISPDNIFLQDIGPPVLLDLGAARLALGDSVKQETILLKVNFAPIEQYGDVDDMPQGPWTDLYSLAAVVHGMLCNQAPLPATVRIVKDTMPTFANVAKTVAEEFGQSYSAEFVAGMAWALNTQPQDRPQSIQEFTRALKLSTPNGMSSFDWRVELGAAGLPNGDLLQLAGAPQADGPGRTDRAQYEYLPTQQIKSTGIKPAASKDQDKKNILSAPPATPAPARRRPYVMWLAMSSLAILVLLAATAGWRGLTSRTPVPAAGPSPNQPAPTLETIPAAAPALTSAGATADSSPPPVPQTPKPSKATKPGTTRTNTPATPLRPVLPTTPEQTGSTSAQAPRETLPKPSPKPEPAALTAEKVCADSNFVTRPMCLYRACQRPELASTASCIEFERQQKRNAETPNR